MSLSGALFLDRDEVHKSPRARQRAKWLYDQVRAEVDSCLELRETPQSPELELPPPPEGGEKSQVGSEEKPRPFPKWGEKVQIDAEEWYIVAEVAEDYPKLLVWLAEGQVRGLWNVFGLWAAVLRLIPGARCLLWRFMFEPVACRAPWRPALYEAILRSKRSAINDKLREEGRLAGHEFTALTVTSGLSAVNESAVIMPVDVRGRLREKVVGMAAGCIGISGLRGSGKTALIRDFCSHRYGTPLCLPPDRKDASRLRLPGLRFVVSAPLRFDAREFLIHLYTCLCRAVLADNRFSTESPAGHVLGPLLRPRSVRPAALIGSLSGIAFLLLSAGLAYKAYGGAWPVLSWHNSSAWEVAGAIASLIASLIAATMTLGWRVRLALIEFRQVRNLRADAQARLRRLHFQRTDTRSRGGTLGGPAGTGLAMGTTRELVEQAMSLPELIDDYRDFAERVVAALVEQHQDGQGDSSAADVRLVIGIDQMDQIDDPKAACKFLDEMSAVFGTPRCVYLLAVSPDALAVVDQRAVPLKTSSGGLFDEMEWIEAFTLCEATKLLGQRVTGLPDVFIRLCYVLSGGLPRELLRVARAVLTTPAARDRITLAGATKHVIDAELQALKHRVMASAASPYTGTIPGLLSALASEDWPRYDAEAPGEPPKIQAALDEVSTLWKNACANLQRRPNRVATEICDSFLAGLYFLLTVRYLFTVLADELNNSPAILRNLANARAALAVSPYLATTVIHQALHDLSDCTGNLALATIEPHPLGDGRSLTNATTWPTPPVAAENS